MENIKDYLQKERERQKDTISLIASENIVSDEVLDALGSELTNKYAEGYPGERYYGGTEIVDEVENKVIELTKEIFGAEYANVQPYSGTPANLAAYMALLEPGEKIMSMKLPAGGHLSHGHQLSLTSKLFEIVHYGVGEDGYLDYDQIKTQTETENPDLIVAGSSSYSREIDFEKFREIADEADAYLLADIAHIAGLVATGNHPDPVPYADIVTTSTHKTLRGPRGGIIMSKAKYKEDIQKSVFPLLQGGPHMNSIAGIAQCLMEVKTSEFAQYIEKVISNSKALARALADKRFEIITDGTDNHLFLVDLQKKNVTGKEAEDILAATGIIVNKNMIPQDPRNPKDPSGIRIGTPLITSRGMGTKDMEQIADWIDEAIQSVDDKKQLAEIHSRVKSFTENFPIVIESLN